METRRLTALIDGDDFVAPSREVNAAGRGDATEQTRTSLQEAVELLFETASDEEITERLHGEVYVGPPEVAVG